VKGATGDGARPWGTWAGRVWFLWRAESSGQDAAGEMGTPQGGAPVSLVERFWGDLLPPWLACPPGPGVLSWWFRLFFLFVVCLVRPVVFYFFHLSIFRRRVISVHFPCSIPYLCRSVVFVW